MTHGWLILCWALAAWFGAQLVLVLVLFFLALLPKAVAWLRRRPSPSPNAHNSIEGPNLQP
jgi:hypothetical protein